MEAPKITRDRIKAFLSEGKRFDGRKAGEFRDIIIETGISKKAEGSARVKIGKTEVIVGVKLEVSAPYPDSPDSGNLMVTAELLPLSSERISSGKPGFDSIEIGRIVDRAIRESKFIDFEKLCIKEKEKVWSIFIDIYSINDDGNMLDASGIGAIAALNEAKMPKYDEKEGKIVNGEWTDKKLPLQKSIPLAITVHKVGKKFLVDPTREEEDVSETRVTIGSYDETIASIQKGERESLSMDELKEILEMAESSRNEVFKKIGKYL